MTLSFFTDGVKAAIAKKSWNINRLISAHSLVSGKEGV